MMGSAHQFFSGFGWSKGADDSNCAGDTEPGAKAAFLANALKVPPGGDAAPRQQARARSSHAGDNAHEAAAQRVASIPAGS
jgi:hypothetical protein